MQIYVVALSKIIAIAMQCVANATQRSLISSQRRASRSRVPGENCIDNITIAWIAAVNLSPSYDTLARRERQPVHLGLRSIVQNSRSIALNTFAMPTTKVPFITKFLSYRAWLWFEQAAPNSCVTLKEIVTRGKKGRRTRISLCMKLSVSCLFYKVKLTVCNCKLIYKNCNHFQSKKKRVS